MSALDSLDLGQSGGETERQRSFAHACLSNLAIDSAIKASGAITAALAM